jgi:hypothetical protein
VGRGAGRGSREHQYHEPQHRKTLGHHCWQQPILALEPRTISPVKLRAPVPLCPCAPVPLCPCAPVPCALSLRQESMSVLEVDLGDPGARGFTRYSAVCSMAITLPSEDRRLAEEGARVGSVAHRVGGGGEGHCNEEEKRHYDGVVRFALCWSVQRPRTRILCPCMNPPPPPPPSLPPTPNS